MSSAAFLAKIEELFPTRGDALHGGEAVSQLEHALQAAWLAEQAHEPPAIIVAALLHDVGHLLHAHGDECAEQGIDDVHEELGMRFLTKFFGPDVTEPVRLHVQAKRFLCHVEPGYHAALSAPSRLSLQLQGGPMTEGEAEAFRENPHSAAACALRKFDDKAKVAELPTPSYSYFAPLLEKCLAHAE